MCSLLHVCGRAWNGFDARKSDVENDHNFYVFSFNGFKPQRSYHNLWNVNVFTGQATALRMKQRKTLTQNMCARISIVYLHNQWVHDTFYIINSKVLETLNGIANGIILWTFILV